MDPTDSTSAALVLQHLGGYTSNIVGIPQGQSFGGQQQPNRGALGGLGIQQQQQAIQSHHHHTLHQQQQQQFGVGMTATTTANAGSTQNSRMYNEKQIKRRTKTGCMTCRKRRIKCDEAKPTCINCQKSRRECEGYQTKLHDRSSTDSTSPPVLHPSSFPSSEYSTPSTLSGPASASFSPVNQRRLAGTHESPRFGSPRFTPYEIYPRTPIEQQDLSSSLTSKQFDPLSGSEYLATDFANDFMTDLSTPHHQSSAPTHLHGLSSGLEDGIVDDLGLQMSMSTPPSPPPTARISIDSLLNLSSAALIHPPIDAPLNALFSPTTNLLPPALMKPYNAGLFAHWINILSQAMATLDRHPTDSSVLEGTPGIHYPSIRVPHEDSVYSVLIPHLALAPTGTSVLHALLACAASHRRERILGMKHYHLALRAVKEDMEMGTTYFVAVTLLGMYEVLGGKGIRCMYLARDWILQHKAELKDKLSKEDGEVTVRDVIIEHMKWTFARTAIHRGLSSLPSISPREGFLFPMPEFRELFVPREGADSTVGIADALIILLAQVISLPSLGENELKAHIAHQLKIWPSTLPRAFRHQWTSQNTISTTSLSTIHFLHPSLAAIHLLHRAGIIYFSIYFNYTISSLTSRKSSPEAVSAARDVLRITQPLIDEASSGRWSVLGALTLAFGPVFVAGQFLKFHLRETPFVVPQMEWLDKECFTAEGGLGMAAGMQTFVESEEDVELREVERMIDRLKVYLGGVEGRVVEL